MEAAFDGVARNYDNSFTHTFTGSEQRNIVWQYLRKRCTEKPLNVLEVNCGTGEDALFMAALGHTVDATDASPEMIKVAKQKQSQSPHGSKVTFAVCDFESLATLNKKYDLIFSNFGGLNCISPVHLKQLSNDVARLLKPQGHLVAVIMPRWCMWETFYFLFKLNFIKAFRRKGKQPVLANVSGSTVPTWYYSPREASSCFSPFFQTHYIRAVGIGIPPSYLEPLVNRFSFLKRFSLWIENLMGHFRLSSYFSDHYLIDLLKKNNA